jgi:DNA-binding transcriptional MerR regulator
MERYSIKDLERLSAINANTIRVWERRYNIIKPGRTDTNRRRYGDAELRKIINISILNRNGLKISAIAKLSDREIEDKVRFLSRETSKQNTQVEALIILMMEKDEKGINDLLIRSIMNIGIEETFSQVVFPFFHRIGVMWQTGATDIGSEHFISNIIRQRIILSLDSLPAATKDNRKKVILFLPENELHEIVLLFYNYIIRKMGHETIYLGQSTPIKSVAGINNLWNADIIVTGLMSGYSDVSPEEIYSQLAVSFPKQKILVAGVLAELAEKNKAPNIFPIKTVADLKSYL